MTTQTLINKKRKGVTGSNRSGRDLDKVTPKNDAV